MDTPASAGDAGLTLVSGRSPGEGHDNPPQYSCLGNLMDRGAWWSTIYGVARVRHNLAAEQHPGITPRHIHEED